MFIRKIAVALALVAILHVTAARSQPLFPASANVPGVSASLSEAPPYTCATNRYVDSISGKDSNPGTKTEPWKTIQNSDNGYPNVPSAGECINIRPGTYKLAKTLIFAHGGNRNSPTGYVVYRSTVPQGAHLVAERGIEAGGNGDLLMLTAPYIIVDGLDVDGNRSVTSGHGIDGCAGGGQIMDVAHHFMVLNSVIHDMGGAGLNSCTADNIIWRNNIVYNTSSTSGYQVSGISVWKPRPIADPSYLPAVWDHAEFGIVIAYNIAHDNLEGPAIPGNHTDGNGIIIDTTFNSSTCPTCDTPYPGKILVLGNVVYNNGGGGIHVFLSENIVVANNTAYNNYLDAKNDGTGRGELSNVGSSNVVWINNIAIAKPGSGSLSHNEPITTFPVLGFRDSAVWKNNIAYGARVRSDSTSYVDPSTNLIGTDPQLANPERQNFTPLPGSPAIRAGLPEIYIPAAAPNIGAY
jgi:parallel beta-helix repeat protein